MATIGALVHPNLRCSLIVTCVDIGYLWNTLVHPAPERLLPMTVGLHKMTGRYILLFSRTTRYVCKRLHGALY